MVKDAKSRGTDLIDTLINTKAVEKSLGDPIMLQAAIDYMHGSLEFVPSVFKVEYCDKIFKEILRCLHLTQDTNDINIMKPQLIYTATSVSNIDKLRQIFDGSFSSLKLNLTNEENWKILFRISASDLYSDKQKQIYLDHLKTIDTTDVGKDWTLAIEGLTLDEEKLDQFWKEIHSKDRTLSYHKVEFLLVGFNSGLRKSYLKQKYAVDFFEKLPHILNEDTKEIGKTVLGGGVPKILSNHLVIQKLREVLPKIKPELEFHKRNVQKYISDLEVVEKSFKLYEF